MKTLILSSSLSKDSKSYILCKEVEKKFKTHNVETVFIDLRDMELNPTHKDKTEDMEYLQEQVKSCNNIVIGMGVHCYSINDSLKIVLDNCFGEGAMDKFFGILCSAGGEKSYLSTMHLTQICMNEFRMIQLPRVVYASGKDFKDNKISNEDILYRIDEFSEEFIKIGKKLL